MAAAAAMSPAARAQPAISRCGQLGLALVLLPSLLIAIAWIYEHYAAARSSDALARLAAAIARRPAARRRRSWRRAKAR